ncbi:rRNA pseudouridine synthase [Pseudonocardiaceae bacterium YIM PH 21723]|nr:rRNA pseudouridine synthase [Pseudonocardiaceae bacterium YIM PH 21723]
MSDQTEGVRLQKVLAQAGVASRRASEELIDQGRVQVDGKVVREQGRRVDPDTAVIHVDGVRVVVRDDLHYLALNKPVGVHSTMHDEEHRPCVGDYLRGREDRLFHVGRLDVETEGLLIMTNDGELANRLMHPRYKVMKTYLAEVNGTVPRDLGKQLRAGIVLDDGPAKVDSFKLVDSAPGRALLELQLHEGRNRIVRRMLDHVGFPVQRLVRVGIADLYIGNQKPGVLRPLNRHEIGGLYKAVGL